MRERRVEVVGGGREKVGKVETGKDGGEGRERVGEGEEGGVGVGRGKGR